MGSSNLAKCYVRSHTLNHCITKTLSELFSVVLGRPGAGCTTLLHTISAHTPASSGIKTSGMLQYDSLPSPLPEAYRCDLQYCPEADVHLPTLTVAQTLAFAARTRTPRSRPDGATRDLCVDLMVEVLLTIFGLRHVRDVKVGNEWVRGVSGGQRKRVSVAEVLAMRGKIICWDKCVPGSLLTLSLIG